MNTNTNLMHKGFLKTAALLGAFSVAIGAFAAHSLKEALPESAMQIFETGVRYQFLHVFAIFIAAILFDKYSRLLMLWAARLFVIGIILFSGSLYVLAVTRSAGANMNWIGIITPFGGVSFIAGWLCMFAAYTGNYDRNVKMPL